MPTLMDRVQERLKRMRDDPDSLAGTPTGFTKFDELTTGLHAGDLMIVAGRPGMGKTSFAMNIAEHVSIERRLPTAVFSMEMPAEQLAFRVLSSFGRIDAQDLRKGDLDDHGMSRLISAEGLLREAPLYIDETGALTPMDLRARARRIKQRYGLGLIVVDYIQLMQGNRNSDSRVNEISEISRSLKALAKELSVPVVALSQLSRAVEGRDNKRPRMSDLRESGGIEQDADVIVFVYRDEYYNKESPDRGTAEIIIAKQRNGPTGTVKTAFIGAYTRFDNLAPEYGYPSGYGS
jgi:replicative DNA helicase